MLVVSWMGASAGAPADESTNPVSPMFFLWEALLVYCYLSNAASCVVYGITCLVQLFESATLFTTLKKASVIKQLVSDEWFPLIPVCSSLAGPTLSNRRGAMRTSPSQSPIVPTNPTWPSHPRGIPRSQTFFPIRPTSLLRLSLLRCLDSKLLGNPLWAWEFHPLELRLCLSRSLRNPESQ